MNQMEVKRNEVLEYLGKLNINRSLGPDGTHPKVLKEVLCKMANLLTKIGGLRHKHLSRSCFCESLFLQNMFLYRSML